MKNLFLLMAIISLLTTACKTETKEQPQQQTTEQPQNETTNTWADFWTTFQQAVAENDKDKIAEYVIFETPLTQANFNEQFEMYFSPEMRELIAQTKAAAVPKNLDGAVTGEDVRNLVLSESGIEDGVEYESALILYFGKVEGRYGLVMWMAAG